MTSDNPPRRLPRSLGAPAALALLGLACGLLPPFARAAPTITSSPPDIQPQTTTAVDLDTPSPPAPIAASSLSPFGFHPASVSAPGYPENGFVDAQYIGVRWHRPWLYANWFLIQPDLGSQSYDFTRFDRQYGAVPAGIDILANIAPGKPLLAQGYTLPGSYLPSDEQQYRTFVMATVERYDGDGLEDMPGLSNPIKHWQVGNEPNVQRWSDFAALQRMTYLAIKAACQDCTVLIGGATGFPAGYVAGFDAQYAPILAELAGQYVDVFDFHWYGSAQGEYRLVDGLTGADVLDHIRSTLTAYGFPADMPIWITEMGAYSGDPADAPRFVVPPQSEGQQAGDYSRRFIYPLSCGVEKVFPAFGLMEGFKHNDGYFDHTGLIYDGRDSGDPGLGVKKLAYYTYKKMTELLEGADWASLTTLQDGTGGDHLYLFHVERDGRPVYIAWWDYFDEPDYAPGEMKSLTLSGIAAEEVVATEVIPAAASGSEVADYATAFEIEVYAVSQGSATILLGESPLIINVLP